MIPFSLFHIEIDEPVVGLLGRRGQRVCGLPSKVIGGWVGWPPGPPLLSPMLKALPEFFHLRENRD